MKRRKIFVFNRRLLSRNAPPPEPVRLEPREIPLPLSAAQVQTNREGVLDSSSPLLLAIADYERQFMFHLCVAEAGVRGDDELTSSKS